MYLETRKVSRKTPGDGKLEISHTTFRALDGAGDKLTASFEGRESGCDVVTFECTCQKMGGPHQHYFAHSILFHQLVPESTVRLDFRGAELQLLVTAV